MNNRRSDPYKVNGLDESQQELEYATDMPLAVALLLERRGNEGKSIPDQTEKSELSEQQKAEKKPQDIQDITVSWIKQFGQNPKTAPIFSSSTFLLHDADSIPVVSVQAIYSDFKCYAEKLKPVREVSLQFRENLAPLDGEIPTNLVGAMIKMLSFKNLYVLKLKNARLSWDNIISLKEFLPKSALRELCFGSTSSCVRRKTDMELTQELEHTSLSTALLQKDSPLQELVVEETNMGILFGSNFSTREKIELKQFYNLLPDSSLTSLSLIHISSFVEELKPSLLLSNNNRLVNLDISKNSITSMELKALSKVVSGNRSLQRLSMDEMYFEISPEDKALQGNAQKERVLFFQEIMGNFTKNRDLLSLSYSTAGPKSSAEEEFFNDCNTTLDDFVNKNADYRTNIINLCITIAFARANARHPFIDSILSLLPAINALSKENKGKNIQKPSLYMNMLFFRAHIPTSGVMLETETTLISQAQKKKA